PPAPSAPPPPHARAPPHPGTGPRSRRRGGPRHSRCRTCDPRQGGRADVPPADIRRADGCPPTPGAAHDGTADPPAPGRPHLRPVRRGQRPGPALLPPLRQLAGRADHGSLAVVPSTLQPAPPSPPPS